MFLIFHQFDFGCKEQRILIEVDGDYYHSNPIFYTKPKTKTQKINHYRDKKKNEFGVISTSFIIPISSRFSRSKIS